MVETRVRLAIVELEEEKANLIQMLKFGAFSKRNRNKTTQASIT
jgi:uncharacterized membrane protein YqjE